MGSRPPSPLIVLAIAAGVGFAIRFGGWALFGFTAGLAYYVASSGIAQGGGYCPPGRWLVPIAPLLAAPLSWALMLRMAPASHLFLPASPLSCCVYSRLLQFSRSVPDRLDLPEMAVSRLIAPAFPVTATTRPDRWAQPAVVQLHTVGGLTTEGRVRGAPSDGPGALTFGPTPTVWPGTYQATFDFPSVVGPPGAIVGTAQMVVEERVVSQEDIVVPQSGSGPVRATLTGYSTGVYVQTRALVNGVGTVVVDAVSMEPAWPGAVRLDPQTNPSAALRSLVFALLIMITLPRPLLGRRSVASDEPQRRPDPQPDLLQHGLYQVSESSSAGRRADQYPEANRYADGCSPPTPPASTRTTR